MACDRHIYDRGLAMQLGSSGLFAFYFYIGNIPTYAGNILWAFLVLD